MGRIPNFDKLKFRPFQKRLGDIAVTNYWVDDLGRKKAMQSHLSKNFAYFEIVKYEKNPYYGRESEYGESFGGEFYVSRIYPFAKIDKNCFKHPESCYVLASFRDLNNDEIIPDLEFCGPRPFALSDEEKEQFWELAKQGYENICKQIKRFVDKHGY